MNKLIFYINAFLASLDLPEIKGFNLKEIKTPIENDSENM